jgi:tRNA1Val (adenine37-N6)-methyltransferase
MAGDALAAKLLFQPERGKGYRANVDAFHLARFAAAGKKSPAHTAWDLGAGAGAVGLALLALDAARHVTFVEIDDQAAALAQKNVEAHAWTARAEVLHSDVARLDGEHAGAADLVVCNPPYVETGRGRQPPEPRRARARMGKLETFVSAARKVAGRRARVCFVYPAGELTALLGALKACGFEPKRLRAVHPGVDAKARIVLVEAQAAKPGGLSIEPPLVEKSYA